jgi:hypothetical protein
MKYLININVITDLYSKIQSESFRREVSAKDPLLCKPGTDF